MIEGKLEQNISLSPQGVEALIKNAVSLIDQELIQLRSFHSDTMKYWICQRFFSPSDNKLGPIEDLKSLLTEADSSDLQSLKRQVLAWREEHLSLMKTHQNHIHFYFSPDYMTRTEKMLLNVFHIFAIDNLDPWVYNTHLKYT